MNGGGYAEREIFTPHELSALNAATRLVALAPYSLGVRFPYDLAADEEPVRCHELARAVVRCLPVGNPLLRVVDGYYGAVEHSWILVGEVDCRRHWSSPTILDVYVPGALPQVQLFDTSSAVPLNHRRAETRTDIRVPIVDELVRIMGGDSRLLVAVPSCPTTGAV